VDTFPGPHKPVFDIEREPRYPGNHAQSARRFWQAVNPRPGEVKPQDNDIRTVAALGDINNDNAH
jgi:hypothetical protein